MGIVEVEGVLSGVVLVEVGGLLVDGLFEVVTPVPATCRL